MDIAEMVEALKTAGIETWKLERLISCADHSRYIYRATWLKGTPWEDAQHVSESYVVEEAILGLLPNGEIQQSMGWQRLD